MIKLDGAKVVAEVVARIIGVASYDLQLTEDQHKHLRDALSSGQLMSKLKVLEMLYSYRINKAAFIGHWHGGLPLLLKKWRIIEEGVGIELDPFWSEFSSKVNWDWNFRSEVGNACTEMAWWAVESQLIINTSCEHMDWRWLQKVPHDVNVLVQATDMEAPDHINRISSLRELENIMVQSGRTVYKSDTLALHAGFSRWTVLAR